MKNINSKKYLIIQMVLSILIVILMPIYLLFDFRVVNKILVMKKEIPFPFESTLDQIYVNREAFYSLLVWYIPMIIAIVASFYIVWKLRARKKKNDYSNLSKFEKFSLFTPIWYLLLKVILINVGEQTFKEYIFSPVLTAGATLGYSEPQANGVYGTIYTIFSPLNLLLPIFLLWPWLSYLDFWRKKKQTEPAA